MTILIGGAVLLIAGSAVALVLGWTSTDETLIWTSIGASVAAAVCLAVAYLRSRRAPVTAPARSSRRTQATAPTGSEETIAAAASAPVAVAAPAATGGTAVEDRAADVAAAASAKRSSAPKTTRAKKTTAATAKKTTAKSADKPATAATTAGQVIAVGDRKKFHRPDCRYAKAKGAERMAKATARRRGYAPCGVCKP